MKVTPFWHFSFFFFVQVFSYRGIRVDTPVVLVVNRRKLGLDKQAPTVLALSTLTDWGSLAFSHRQLNQISEVGGIKKNLLSNKTELKL